MNTIVEESRRHLGDLIEACQRSSTQTSRR
jgi:hypothetical protein